MQRNSDPTRRLPAEWEPQRAVLMAWPHDRTDWAPILDHVELVFANIAASISRREQVLIVAPDPDAVTAKLATAGVVMERVRVVVLETNDTWTRDYGPITVSGPTLLKFVFNGWGLKYPADKDNQVVLRLHAAGVFGDVTLECAHFVLEGGSIECDGEGTILTTAACLLHPNRNPGLSRAEIEQQLKISFNVSRVLWLEHGFLVGDDTDSHVDTLARFAPNDTIVYTACVDRSDEHYPALKAMEQELRAFRTTAGRPYRLLPLPWPGPKRNAAGQRLPATYANFLVINGSVLVPTYRDPADAAALSVVQSAFPDRRVEGIDCLPLIQQHGSLHCVTMQIPSL